MKPIYIAIFCFLLVNCKTVDTSDLATSSETGNHVFCAVTSVSELDARAPLLAECSQLKERSSSNDGWSGYLELATMVNRARFTAYDANGEEHGYYTYTSKGEPLAKILEKSEIFLVDPETANPSIWSYEGKDIASYQLARLEILTLATSYELTLHHSPDMEGPELTLGPQPQATPASTLKRFAVVAYPDIENSYALAMGDDYPTGSHFLTVARRADSGTRKLIDDLAETDFINFLEHELSEPERQNRVFILFWHEREPLEQLAQRLNSLLTEDK